MHDFSSIADDFFFNVTLNTELALPTERETLLFYFEQVQKKFPSMRNFFSRERTEFVLEEDKESGFYRWTSIEPKRISSGWANPPSIEEAMAQHRFVLESVPYTLSVSPLDCEALSLTLGFDFAYRGNQQELVWEALGYAAGFDSAIERPGSRLIGNDYSMTVALDDECRTQFRLHIEPRTAAYQIRTGDYGEEPLSIYLTVRRLGSLDSGETYAGFLEKLYEHAINLMDEFVVEKVITPIQQTIALK